MLLQIHMSLYSEQIKRENIWFLNSAIFKTHYIPESKNMLMHLRNSSPLNKFRPNVSHDQIHLHTTLRT